jgi:hypothetical protein
MIESVYQNALSWLVGTSQISESVKEWSKVDALWICVNASLGMKIPGYIAYSA